MVTPLAAQQVEDDGESQPTRQLPDNADPVVDYKTATDRPGRLRGTSHLTIETRQAQRLVYGRAQSDDKQGIIGLVKFAMIMGRIWRAAELDDPYADSYLLQIHEALTTAQAEIKQATEQIQERLKSVSGVDITVAHSLEPVQVPLHFPNAYGYMGGYLIADFDTLVRSVLTAVHVALMTRDEGKHLLHNTGRMIRRSFLLPTRWKYCIVTRDDIRQSTQRGAMALEAMGELPQEILDETRRAPHAPTIRKPGSRSTSSATVDLLDDSDDDEEEDEKSEDEPDVD
ncbi:TIGR03761 family integrating conjugative element protein [bacterium endosymbiont of Escarpia laminata]|nr:MAG: TIGR03761 family integrating conjugative element protein [bacterium endosymbiont of Escarpia laminata]